MQGEGGRLGEGWKDTGRGGGRNIHSFKEQSLCTSPLAVSQPSLCSLGYSYPASFLQNNITKGKKNNVLGTNTGLRVRKRKDYLPQHEFLSLQTPASNKQKSSRVTGTKRSEGLSFQPVMKE